MNMIKLSSLKPKPGNPRKISDDALAKLAESIKRDPEFMRLRPIIVDCDGTVIGGNQRAKACQLLGMDEVPDDWVRKAEGLTDEQLRRFVLVDNAPSGMAGDWDADLLLDEWDASELEGLGFDLDALGIIEPMGEMPDMPDGDKEPYKKMTFILHDEQAEIVSDAITLARTSPLADTGINENGNGNALALICREWMGARNG